MLSKIKSISLTGLEGNLVEVQTDIRNGIPEFEIVGLPDIRVKESKKRIESAIRNSQIEFPSKKILINLAPANIRKEGSSFDVYHKDELIGHFDLPLYGKHMILNALSVIIFSYLEGLNMEEVHDSIKTFKGAKRRFKENFIKNVVTIDDYAHHPTEIKVTLEAVRQKYPDKELVAVFLENTFSRTEMLYREFADALNVADKAYVTDIFSDRETKEEYPNVSPMLIVNRLKNGEHLKVGSIENLIDINDTKCIEPLLKHDNAVIVFMGCKEVYDLKEKLEKRLLEK